jgi:Subtilase family
MATRHSSHRAFGLVVVLVAASGTAAVGQELSEQARRQIGAIYADQAGWTAAQRKLGTSLLYASRESRGQPMVQGMTTDQDLALVRRVASGASVGPDGMVVVDIKAKVTDGLILAIAGAGGRVMSAFPAFGAVRARIPVRRVEEIAALDEVRHISPRQEFLLNTGSATSEGDAAHKAAAARLASGLDGTGIRIGVLSDGVDSLAARQATNDLPDDCASPPGAGPCVKVVQECDLTGQPPGTTCGDEGTAMMEIVHDLAPGAQLYFATAMDGDAAFAQNILKLKNDYGCDVIVDDVTYLNEGAFQDGVIAQAVTTVKNAGALYFSSAGNSGRKDAGTSGTWEGDWVSSGCTLEVGGLPEGPYGPVPLHSFSGGTGCSAAASEYINYGYSSGHIVTLKWSDPLGASGNNYDLFTYNGSYITYYSIDIQNGNDDPIEGVIAFPGDYLLVTKRSGATRALRIDTNRARLVINTPGAVVGHNGSENAISVAATDGRIPGAGNPFVGSSTNPIESYSSDGPRWMFYNPNGSAITPGNVLFGTGGGRRLAKPDITAADCVLTTTPGFIPFCGTSAAAPHAAAIAALLKSTPNNPGGGQVLAAMMTTALDVTPGTGRDRNSGVGIVMADTALAALTTMPAVDFYTVSPCRVVDTRETGGALSCGIERAITMGGACGVPTGTKAVSVNVTVTAPSATGNLKLYAAGAPAPSASTLNYVGGQTRANNAVAPLNTSGQTAVLCSPTGTAHVIVDVNGYFK